MDIILIPAYEPDEELIGLVTRLKDRDFGVLVVDDGSGGDYAHIFDQVRQQATVVTHARNRGKGAALKTGMAYIRDKMPECEFFITCDADGQHRVEDVVRVRDMLHKGHGFVLSTRTPKKGTPLRSRIGNHLSRVVYALLANRYLSDNQSGLRGFSRVHIDWLIKVEKNNYDYEMNMLYYASKKNIHITTLPIETIYINNNAASHFNPILDTLRIYRSLFYLARGSMIAFLVSELLVLLVSIFIGYDYLMVTVPTVGALSCMVSAALNRFVVFRNMPCFDYLKNVIYTVISYFVYMLGCQIFMYATPWLPLFAAFNLVFLICIPLRYFLHKFTFIASRTRE